MSRRLAALAALAVVLGCAGCDAADLDSAKSAASSAGDQLTSETADKLQAQLDEKKAEAGPAAAAAKQAAEKVTADLTAQAKAAVQEQIAAAVKEAKDTAVKAAASAAASAAPSPVAVASAAAAAADTTHAVTGTYTAPELVDASSGSVPCATLANVVGQQVRINGATGVLTACTWSVPGPFGSSRVFAFEVKQVPEASSYDVSIGDRSWKVSGTTLAASGWKLALI
jgi:hypothetical protein